MNQQANLTAGKAWQVNAPFLAKFPTKTRWNVQCSWWRRLCETSTADTLKHMSRS